MPISSLRVERNWREVFAGGPARAEAIAVSCRSKAAIVARDEFETGDRALLNLGHTFGHAIETAAGYNGTIVHGEAVCARHGARPRLLDTPQPDVAG